MSRKRAGVEIAVTVGLLACVLGTVSGPAWTQTVERPNSIAMPLGRLDREQAIRCAAFLTVRAEVADDELGAFLAGVADDFGRWAGYTTDKPVEEAEIAAAILEKRAAFRTLAGSGEREVREARLEVGAPGVEDECADRYKDRMQVRIPSPPAAPKQQ